MSRFRRADCWRPSGWLTNSVSMPACRRTTFRRGASARVSPNSHGRGWARRWRSTAMPFGIVNAPGQRYHLAIIAQAVATLAEMFPGRIWVALGTGEASNEHVTGAGWPEKGTRTARLRECVEVIRALLGGDEVTHHGSIEVDRARLWTLPETPPPLIGAAVTAETAALVGGWADGLVTVNQEPSALERVIGAFREGGGVEAGVPPGACVLGPVGGGGVGDRPRSMAHQCVQSSPVLGPRPTVPLRRRRHVRTARRRSPLGAGLGRPCVAL